MKRLKYYVCPNCGNVIQSTLGKELSCCGMELTPLKPQACDETHTLKITEIDGDFYVEFKHEMTKEHYLSFVSYLGYDRVITVRLYPEGDASVRLPRAYLGKILYYCNKHGLFEYQLSRKK